ncbi:MAG: sigma-70 family RNA polymerase sigma factor [Planctomycetaceae bacterium]|nr:sigma-70 family RNA polymerase sigma factor [Planctomycetaceae bacterium]
MDDLSATPSPDGPERLLQRYLDGDDDAFGALVARYESSLYAYIVRMVGDAHAAEDVFQQTCIKVAKGAAGFDGRASFSTWLFRIARNAALDELRRQAARKGWRRAGWTTS